MLLLFRCLCLLCGFIPGHLVSLREFRCPPVPLPDLDVRISKSGAEDVCLSPGDSETHPGLRTTSQELLSPSPVVCISSYRITTISQLSKYAGLFILWLEILRGPPPPRMNRGYSQINNLLSHASSSITIIPSCSEGNPELSNSLIYSLICSCPL